jgi:predicted nucleic acid-binding protein
VTGFLLDTNIISEVRKGPRADTKVLEWYQNLNTSEIYLSVLTFGEIRDGIERCRHRDPHQAARLEQWLIGLQRTFTNQTLPITTAISEQWGRFAAIRPVATVDCLLAATAFVHGLTFVTRNHRDVRHTGVVLLNPFT